MTTDTNPVIALLIKCLSSQTHKKSKESLMCNMMAICFDNSLPSLSPAQLRFQSAGQMTYCHKFSFPPFFFHWNGPSHIKFHSQNLSFSAVYQYIFTSNRIQVCSNFYMHFCFLMNIHHPKVRRWMRWMKPISFFILTRENKAHMNAIHFEANERQYRKIETASYVIIILYLVMFQRR